MKKQCFAFTLAEVLITLTIIGIVASMTIPALMNNINNMELKAAWKTAYSNLAQTFMLVAADNNNDIGDACFNNPTYGTDARHCFADLFKPKLKYIKACDAGCGGSESDSFYGNCWHKQGSFYYLDGTPHTEADCRAGFILSNGMLLAIREGWINAPDIANSMTPTVWIDVNGFKAPNTIGKDIFAVIGKTESGSVTPCGEHELKDCEADNATSCSNSDTGWGCSAKYLQE